MKLFLNEQRLQVCLIVLAFFDYRQLGEEDFISKDISQVFFSLNV